MSNGNNTPSDSYRSALNESSSELASSFRVTEGRITPDSGWEGNAVVGGV
jgi:hypothetical protein